MIPQRFRLFTIDSLGARFGLKSIQSDPMTAGAYIPQLWGGADQLVRRNLLLNTATLATQNVTTLGLSYTLYIKGTGSVTLSGTATGTLNGTGAGNRVSLQFTPTAGTLSLTVSGSVTEGHLTRTATTDHSYQAITDWTTEVYQYNAQRQLPWLRRNRLVETSTFSGWVLGSVVTGQPDYLGGTKAAQITTSTTGQAFKAVGNISSVAQHASVILKKDPSGTRYLMVRIEGTPNVECFIDLQTGAITATLNVTAAFVDDLGSGFYRLSLSGVSTAGYFTLQKSNDGTTTASGATTLIAHQPMLAVGATFSSYQEVGASWPPTYTALAQAAGYPITLYSDRFGTIAVDSPETVVGKALDLSTKGNHLVAPSDAARPLLKRDGNGNYYLLRDLVDDSLDVTLPNYGSNCATYQQDAATCNKATSVTLNGATSLSTPAVDYARVLLQGPSNNDAKIQKYLNKLAGL